MELNKNEVHIWSFPLYLLANDITLARSLLSTQELQRADRFYNDTHRKRFISAHYYLRNILALYLDIPVNEISYDYSQYGKPSLASTLQSTLQFNLSHSHELGVCAISNDQNIGIDIEKIEIETKEDLAKRFFSPLEYQTLMTHEGQARIELFYAIWARKEAILKATGKGLSIPLSQFSVPLSTDSGTLELDGTIWTLFPLNIHPDYGSALAITGSVKKMTYLEWDENKPKLIKEDVI